MTAAARFGVVYIEDAGEGDAEAAAILRNKHRYWFIDSKSLRPEDNRIWIKNRSAQDRLLIIRSSLDSRLVGTIGWRRTDNGRIEVGRLAADSHSIRALRRQVAGCDPSLDACKALSKLLLKQGIRNVIAETMKHNTIVMRLLHAMNFVLVGRRCETVDGRNLEILCWEAELKEDG